MGKEKVRYEFIENLWGVVIDLPVFTFGLQIIMRIITIGLDEHQIREYVMNQKKLDQGKLSQLTELT